MWQTEMVTIVRNLTGDIVEPYDYSDSRLEQLILVAAQQVNFEVTFSQTFIVDIDGASITPDPTDRSGETRDDAFVNLVSLKAACIIDTSEAKNAASQATKVKDADTEIDFGQSGQLKIKMLGLGACKTYEELKNSYLSSNLVGHAILSGRGYCGCDSVYPYSYPVDWRYR